MTDKNLSQKVLMFSKLLAIAVLIVSVISCGGQIQPPTTTSTITTAQVFYMAPANPGDKLGFWLFGDGLGGRMSITIWKPAPSDFFDWTKTVVWSYDKNNCGSYWQPGICSPHLDFVLTQQPDGSYVSSESLMNFQAGCPYVWCTTTPTLMSVDILAPPGMPTPYLIIPSQAVNTGTISVDTAYSSSSLEGTITFNAVPPPPDPFANLTHWRTDTYIETITVGSIGYSGPAMVSEQFEGPCFNPDGSYNPQSIGCAHEKWYFAPGWGLVRVIPLNDGSGEQNFNPLTVMDRI